VAGITSVGVEAVYVPNQGDWTQDMVVRLKKSLTYPAAITLLDMAAAKPNKEIKFPEIGARSGLSDKQVAAELGAMSKLSRKLFDGQKIWPIRWWQDASDNITRYVMHPRMAGVVAGSLSSPAEIEKAPGNQSGAFFVTLIDLLQVVSTLRETKRPDRGSPARSGILEGRPSYVRDRLHRGWPRWRRHAETRIG